MILSADGIFIGPYDLSLSLGYPPPNPDPHPKVEEAIQRILKTAHEAGKKWSVLTLLVFPRGLTSLPVRFIA
jgi:2-keto-3-deoxy-L-rhamnonate aldolase RhmA